MRRPSPDNARGLRQQGVGLAVHLLQQEVQLLAGFAALLRAPRENAGCGCCRRTISSWMSLRSASSAASCRMRSVIGVAADQLLHAGLHFLQVGVSNGAAQLLDLGGGAAQARHALAQFPLDAASFLEAHAVELGDGFFQSREHAVFALRIELGFRPRLSAPGMRKHGIEVGLAGDAEFPRGLPKGLARIRPPAPGSRPAPRPRRRPGPASAPRARARPSPSAGGAT